MKQNTWNSSNDDARPQGTILNMFDGERPRSGSTVHGARNKHGHLVRRSRPFALGCLLAHKPNQGGLVVAHVTTVHATKTGPAASLIACNEEKGLLGSMDAYDAGTICQLHC